ncbi:unnamed protein product [Mytilus edulis]|uniref:C-type lectin domain-containing protein n=1 Tax=Mytilus edulis TaxID=6550 RepID=A0A8S3USW9_MYTED|nr:unnamed protein product [Mytilus edulis]
MWKLQLLLLGFLSVNCDILVKQTRSFTQNSDIINKLCDDGLLVVYNQTSTLQCAKLCALNDNCASFFVNSHGHCQLNSVIIYDTTSCASLQNTMYYVSKKFVVKGTTEDPLKMTTGDTSTLGIECDIEWLLLGPTKDYFIGGSDLATEGKFIWEYTGLPVNLPGSNLFHDWRTNQPDNKNGNQHCIMLGYQVSFNWNDAQCAYPRDFICEKSPVY